MFVFTAFVLGCGNAENDKNTAQSDTTATTQKKELKNILKLARYSGGLLEKPGHIFLKIKLKKTKNVNLGYVYASKKYIHFDGGIDKNNKEFTGSYLLPKNFDFDNYK